MDGRDLTWGVFLQLPAAGAAAAAHSSNPAHSFGAVGSTREHDLRRQQHQQQQQQQSLGRHAPQPQAGGPLHTSVRHPKRVRDESDDASAAAVDDDVGDSSEVTAQAATLPGFGRPQGTRLQRFASEELDRRHIHQPQQQQQWGQLSSPAGHTSRGSVSSSCASTPQRRSNAQAAKRQHVASGGEAATGQHEPHSTSSSPFLRTQPYPHPVTVSALPSYSGPSSLAASPAFLASQTPHTPTLPPPLHSAGSSPMPMPQRDASVLGQLQYQQQQYHQWQQQQSSSHIMSPHTQQLGNISLNPQSPAEPASSGNVRPLHSIALNVLDTGSVFSNGSICPLPSPTSAAAPSPPSSPVHALADGGDNEHMSETRHTSTPSRLSPGSHTHPTHHQHDARLSVSVNSWSSVPPPLSDMSSLQSSYLNSPSQGASGSMSASAIAQGGFMFGAQGLGVGGSGVTTTSATIPTGGLNGARARSYSAVTEQRPSFSAYSPASPGFIHGFPFHTPTAPQPGKQSHHAASLSQPALHNGNSLHQLQLPLPAVAAQSQLQSQPQPSPLGYADGSSGPEVGVGVLFMHQCVQSSPHSAETYIEPEQGMEMED